MAVLRCPYCGEKIQKGAEFCSHCGKQIDKPHIDEIDTYFQETGSIIGKLILLVILWFIIVIIVGFIGNLLNFPKYSPTLFLSTFVVTAIVVIAYKLLR